MGEGGVASVLISYIILFDARVNIFLEPKEDVKGPGGTDKRSLPFLLPCTGNLRLARGTRPAGHDMSCPYGS